MQGLWNYDFILRQVEPVKNFKENDMVKFRPFGNGA